MVNEIKILKGLAELLVSDRQKRKEYVTARTIKAFDTFICLKALTTSGHIQNYPGQMDLLLKFCKISKAIFYTRINYLQAKGFVTKDKRKISLASWEKVADQYELPIVDFISLNYDSENKLQTAEYLIRALEAKQNQDSQLKAAVYKLNKTPEIKEAFFQYTGNQELTLENIHLAQVKSFAFGAAVYDQLHQVNVDLQRTATSIKKAYKYKSIRNVAYLKRELERRGLAVITKRPGSICRYLGQKKKEKTRGNTFSLGEVLKAPELNPKIKRGSKPKDMFFTWYDSETKLRTWYLPDKIEINSQIFKSNEAEIQAKSRLSA